MDDDTFREVIAQHIPVAELAERWGCTENAIYVRAHLSSIPIRRKCKDCGSLPRPGFARCKACRVKHRDKARAIREARREAGLCQECGKSPAVYGTVCPQHVRVQVKGPALTAAIQAAWGVGVSTPEEFAARLLARLVATKDSE